MVLFDDEIKEVHKLLESLDKKELPITNNLLKDVGNNNMVFSNESAYELGENHSLSFEFASSEIDIADKIFLVGKDLSEIEDNDDFMRITLLNIRDDSLSSNALYDRLEQIKLAKYKVSPIGYMLRSATGNKERVRVSKSTAKESFSKIGSAYIKEYKKLNYVNNVTIIFIVGNTLFDKEFEKLANKKKEIIDTIDHILKGLMVNDCDACSVKELCDEVEGLREIHKNGKS